ncbi:MAG: hypothetical protein ACPGSN_05210 [Psychrobium sp.]
MDTNLHIPEFEQMMVNTNLEDVYLNQLFDIYHQQLLGNSDAQIKLARRGISEQMIEQHQLGHCNRTLHHYVDDADTVDGGGFRGTLQSLALIKPETGHELLRGCIIEPLLNEEGNIVAACGIKLICPSRPAPRIIQWFRYKHYPFAVQFQLMTWGKRYVH